MEVINFLKQDKTCGNCGKKLHGVHSVLGKILGKIIRMGNLWTYSPTGQEQYYRYYGERRFHCKRCFDDPNWINREEQERKINEVRKTAHQNTQKLADLQKRKEQTRAQATIEENMHQVQSIVRPTIPPHEAEDMDTNNTKPIFAYNKLDKNTVSELLKCLWRNPELFCLLTSEQIISFNAALGDLLVEWGHTTPSDVPIEIFQWIHVFLVEQYLDFNQFDLSEVETTYVQEVLTSILTAAVNVRELIEITTCTHQVIDRVPIIENDTSPNIGDSVAAGFIHLLLSDRFSEIEGSDSAYSAEWPRAACLVLVNILIEPPQKDKYDYRRALSKLVNGKIWKPLEVVDLLVSIQSYVQSEDENLSEALEYLIVSQSGSTLGEGTMSVTDILKNRVTESLLRKVRLNNSEGDNAEKDVQKLYKEIKENNWAKPVVLEKAMRVTKGVMGQLMGLGYPDGDIWDTSLIPPIMILGETIMAEEKELQNVLTVLCCAVKKSKGYLPRVAQILSCSLLATAGKDHGRLLEIATGEGKSCIIAMFSAVLALSGMYVDIVTSSPLLAERDCDEWRQFYQLCILSVSHNIKADNDAEKQKCYKANVVYGTVSSFASDILRQEFHLRQTRGSRDLEKCAMIADEVDFMLLDRGVQFTYLSDKSLGLRHLEPLFATIWTTVSQLIPIKIEGDVCFADQPRPFHEAIETAISTSSNVSIEQILQKAEEDRILDGFLESIKNGNSAEKLLMIDSEKMIQLFERIRRELHQGLEVYTMQEGALPVKIISAVDESQKDECSISIIIIDKGHCLVIGKDEKCLQAGITEEIREMVSSKSSSNSAENVSIDAPEDKSKRITVPIHLHEFVEDRISVWVRSAFQALLMTRDREYHIRDGQVLPIDFGSTGVIEANKKWGDGLQQFVELKHHLQISEISLVTNYMSNLEFFKRYGHVFGVTGTLGSETDKGFLKRQFKVDLCHVPTHQKRKLYEDTGRILQNVDEWISAITEEVSSEIKMMKWKKGARAALVICEDIISAEKVKSELSGKVPGHLYLIQGKVQMSFQSWSYHQAMS